MKKLPRRVAVVLLVVALATGGAFYLQRGGISAGGDTNAGMTPGRMLAIEKGCNACHSFDGSAGIGPTWKGTYGTLRMMTDGSQHLADDTYLRKSMLEPAAQVVAGFENIMIPPVLTEAEIMQLLLLIRELGSADPQ